MQTERDMQLQRETEAVKVTQQARGLLQAKDSLEAAEEKEKVAFKLRKTTEKELKKALEELPAEHALDVVHHALNEKVIPENVGSRLERAMSEAIQEAVSDVPDKSTQQWEDRPKRKFAFPLIPVMSQHGLYPEVIYKARSRDWHALTRSDLQILGELNERSDPSSQRALLGKWTKRRNDSIS